MANTLSNAGIVDGQIIYAVQVNQIIDALTSADDYDISISGSLELTGSLSWSGSTDASGNEIQFVVRDTASGELYTTGSSAFDFKLSGSFPAERLVITENTSSANPGGLATSNNLRTFNNNNGIAIGGSEGSNGVVGLGLIISEDSGNGNHTIVSDGSGSNLNIRAAGGDEGDRYVVILSDQAGTSVSDVFEIAKFGGPLRGAELYHTGSLVLNTAEIGANKAVVITGTISASAEAYLSGLANTTTPHIVGFDTSSGKLSYYSTASFGGGGSTDTGSLMVTGSVIGNVLTFEKGDGSTFDLTVDTGSAASINTGSFYVSSSVTNATITFTQGDTTTEAVTVNNVTNSISSSYASTASLTIIATGVYKDSGPVYIGSGIGFDTITVDGLNTQVVNITALGNSIITGSLDVNGRAKFNGGVTGSFSGSFQGNGSGLTGVPSSSYATTASFAPGIRVDGLNDLSTATNVKVLGFTGVNMLQVDSETAVATIVSSSYAITSSHTPKALVTASLAGSTLIFEKGDNSQFSLVLPGGGGGNPITGSYTGSLLTTNIQSIDFTGAGVVATVGGSNDITVNIPGGGSTDTGSLMVTGSVSLNTLTFTKGDGSIFNLTVDTGSAAIVNTGSFYYSSSVSLNTITFYQGDGTTEDVIVDTGSVVFNTGSLMVTGSVSNATLTFEKGDGSTFPLIVNNVNNAVSASYAPNLYNSDGTLTGTRRVNLSTNDLIFNNSGAKFIISGSDRVYLNNLSQGNFGSILTYDPTGVSGEQGIISYVSASSLLVASASYAPNVYNSNGTLTGDRVVTLGNNNEFRFAPGTGTSEVRVSDGPSGGPLTYEIVMSNTGEFRVDSAVSSSFFTDVFVDGGKVLTLEPANPLPSGVPTGSFAVSASVPPRPYMWDGSAWYAL